MTANLDQPSTIEQSIQALTKQLKPGQRYAVARPSGSGDAYFLSLLAQQIKKTIVVFSADPIQARRLVNEVNVFNSSLNCLHFPDWETLPYDAFSPHQDLVSERLLALHALRNDEVDILVVPVTTALACLAPVSFIAAYTFSFKKGQRLNEKAFKEQLILANYEHVAQVTVAGEFSIRGSLIDLFPMGSAIPYRIDLFDDEIDSIRAFNVDTQRSLYPVDQINLLPGREFPMDEAARNHFRSKFREYFEGDPSKALPYRDISNGIAFAGVEYYLPLFYPETATIFDYLPEDSISLSLGNLETSIASFHGDTRSRYEFLKYDSERPILAPENLYLSAEQFFVALSAMPRVHWMEDQAHPQIKPSPDVAVQSRAQHPFQRLEHLLLKAENRTVLCADSAGRRETLLQILSEHALRPDANIQSLEQVRANKKSLPNFSLVVANLYKGFSLPDENIVVLTEGDLYPETAASRLQRRKKERQTNVDSMVRDLSELIEGDPVVHVNYGIGRYLGLVNMDVGDEGPVEMLKMEYADNSELFVPVSQLHVISRYSGADPENAPLHSLGSGQWDKAKKKAAIKIRDTAAELLNLYAHRASRQGIEFKLPMTDYQAFVEGFGFEETPDQAAAIEAVIEDMTSGKPMDRLVCGDVGFGKTEVALRAAFIAVANGKQVALLCPTTLLAEQHAQTFANRFADWPVTVAELSRFRTGKQTQQVLESLEKGTTDIVVGTHKILAKSTKFKNLGLVIIDEEHRFGVRQKEALKALRAEVDILTLTATPIPRTLGMSLEGVRDFSVIATAPEKRLAIKTFVRREDSSTIREACLRELKRGGQVYFLHNEVSTIYNRADRLQELIPEARIGVAHGQMSERELEQVMKGFYQQRYNVLLCTTIIETGIDVPSANTIIIHRADKLGLAQLHQLRGRVGRSHHQAYAYLLTPGEDAITPNARKRLEAIQSMEELGSGFYLAMHDLEIRGSGEILGDSQSGNIHEIGFSLYNEMLNKAIKALRDGKEPDYESPFDQSCEVRLHASALLPNDYCPDVSARLSIYKRLSHASSLDELRDIQEEMIDRFGSLVDEAKNLLSTHRLRLLAEPFTIMVVDIGDDKAIITFDKSSQVDPLSLIDLVQRNKHIHFKGPERILIDLKEGLKLEQRIQEVATILGKLRHAPAEAPVN